MKLNDIQSRLQLEIAACEEALDREVTGGYCGDLLSDVMANAAKGHVWITIQGHQNVVAVAVLRELAAIILANGRRPDEDTVNKAKEEGIPILVSPMSSFKLTGKLFEAGIGSAMG